MEGADVVQPNNVNFLCNCMFLQTSVRYEINMQVAAPGHHSVASVQDRTKTAESAVTLMVSLYEVTVCPLDVVCG